MTPFFLSQISLHGAVQRWQVLIHKFQDKDSPSKAYKILRVHKNLQELDNNKLLLERMRSRGKFKLLFCRPLKYGATNGDSEGLVRDKLASYMTCGQEHHAWLQSVSVEESHSFWELPKQCYPAAFGRETKWAYLNLITFKYTGEKKTNKP